MPPVYIYKKKIFSYTYLIKALLFGEKKVKKRFYLSYLHYLCKMHINSNVMQKSHHCYCKDSTSVDLPEPFQIIFQGFGIIFLKFLQHHIGSWVEEGFWTDSSCSPRGTLGIYALVKAKQLSTALI